MLNREIANDDLKISSTPSSLEENNDVNTLKEILTDRQNSTTNLINKETEIITETNQVSINLISAIKYN